MQERIGHTGSEEGWVSHDLNEIWNNVLQVLREVVEKSGIKKEQIACIGITNQRETIAAWDRESGKPLADAIVWQCSRAAEICDEIEDRRQQGKRGWLSEL